MSPARRSLGEGGNTERALGGSVVGVAAFVDRSGGEAEFGAGRGHRHVAYLTIGTGIGGGFLHDGRPILGRMHTEVGHLLVPDLDEPGRATGTLAQAHQTEREQSQCEDPPRPSPPPSG